MTKLLSDPKPSSHLIRGGRLIDATLTGDSPQDLLIIDGKISDIGKKITAPAQTEIIEAETLFVAPGLIDMRVQTREPGGEHEETLASAVESAIAGGITQMVCLPNTDPVLDEPALIAWIRHKAEALGKTKIHAYGALTKGRRGEQLAEMGLLQDSGAIGFTDSPDSIGSARLMVQALKYARGFNSLVLSHPEEPSLASGMMNEGELATRLGLAGRSSLAETLLVERDCAISEATGSRLHIGPVTSAAAIDAIRRAKARGVKITCDTAAHYFTLTELAVGNWRTFAKVAPPLRSESDRLAVIAGLKDGTIDAISSDHSPRAPDSKRLPFAQASFGMVGLETLFPLTLNLVHQQGFSLARALSLVTSQPAKILGINGGTLAIGSAADLVIFDPNQDWPIDPEKFKSRSKNSPLLNHPVKGKIHMTLINGKIVFTSTQ